MRRSIQWVVVGSLVALGSACTPEDKCEKVVCNVGTACDPSDGICKEPSLIVDSGTGGNEDAGQTGDEDAGHDAGTKTDAGTDAGVVTYDNDTCVGAEPVTFTNNVASFTAELSGALDDFTPANTCNGQPQSVELFYRFNVTEPSSVRITSQPSAGAVSDPVIYLLRDCADTLSVVCADVDNANPQSPQETIDLPSLAPGDYLLVVESYGSAGAGKTDIQITLAEPQPVPDTCSSAIPVPFTDGTYFMAQTSAGVHEYTGTCAFQGASAGPDFVYSLSLTAESDVMIYAQAAALGVDPVIYLRAANCESGLEVACSDDDGPPSDFGNGSEQIFLRGLAAGDYFVFFDNWDPNYTGPMYAIVDVGPSTKPTNDTCLTPTELLAGGATTETFVVTPTNGEHEYYGTCNDTFDDSEVVYRFNLPTPQNVTVSANTPADGGFTTYPVLFIRETDCETGTELACIDTFSDSRNLTLPNLAAGDYFLFVEGYSSSAVEVTISTSPASSADTCAAPAQVFLDSSGDAGYAKLTHFPTTNGVGGELDGTCLPAGATSGRDLVYEVTLPTDSQFKATVTPLDRGAGTVEAYAYLREQTACGETGAIGSLGCMSQGGTESALTLSAPVLGAGTHYFVVDTLSADAGSFQVQFEALPVAPISEADDCSLDGGARAISTFGTAVRDSTFASKDERSFSCGATPSVGKDNVYRFTTGGPTDGGVAGYSVRASVISENLDLLPAPMLQIRQGSCTGTGPEVLCAAGDLSTQGRAYAIADGLKSNTEYSVVVDSATATAGGFYTVSVDVDEFPVAYDSCAAPRLLFANSSPSTYTTLSATNDFSSASGYSGANCSLSLDGADVVFKYIADTTGTATVRATQEGLTANLLGYDLALAAFEGACGTGTCIGTVDATGQSRGEVLSFPVTMGSTYYVVVDSNQPTNTPAGRGSFRISVEEN